MIRFTLALPLILGACVPAHDRAADLSLMTGLQADESHSARFAETCLNGASSESWFEHAGNHGWIVANDDWLATNGFAGLRRTVLQIPGGGAHVSETQAVFQKAGSTGAMALSIETSKSRDGGQTAKCTVHVMNADHLAVCASLGRALGRAPDRNQRYKDRDAQFIGWDMHHGGKPTRIGCDKPSVPPVQSGVVMSMTMDLTPNATPVRSHAAATANER